MGEIKEMKWFTSDTHFGHKGVIEYCARPFASVPEMDAELIRRWNVLVKPEDTVYHMGDFAFCGAIRTTEILKQLNGKKILVRGNHDHWKSEKYMRLGFEEVLKSWSVYFGDELVRMSHFPYKGEEADERTFTDSLVDDGKWLLHGHVHTTWKTNKRMINVGVDRWDFAPVSEKEILDLIQ